MKTFKEIAIEEALKIVRRASDKPVQKSAKKQKEVKTSKKASGKTIGDINGTKIVKSHHVSEIRDGELESRDGGLKDSVIIKAIKKAIKKGFSQKSPKTLITFKNKKKLYDLLIVKWARNAIVIITIIQDNKNNPKLYYTPKRKSDGSALITTESFNKEHNIPVTEIDIEN
jgi:hypothetical protein